MKKLNYLFLVALVLLGSWSRLQAQVTVTSSDSLSCTTNCTTLTAHLTGDEPINSGITVDDVYSVVHPIGFPFVFYGATYTSLVIGPNGTLCFDLSLAGGYDPWPITAVLLGNASKYNNICGPWCDIDISIPGGGTITYSLTGVAPYRKYIVTYCNDHMFSCTTQITSTQMILYETTNIIECHIATKPVCAGWNGGHAIIGVQNATGTAATVAPGRDFPAVYTCTDEAWRFTPDASFSSYTVSAIPYAPVPYASSLLYWYNVNTGAYLGTGESITVCPTTTTTYKAGALGCADTSFGYYTVTPAGAFTITPTPTNPTQCGLCNGTITISGLTAGEVDTITYNYGGVPQPPYIATASASGTVTLTGLCAGTYDNFIAHQSICESLPAGPVVLNDPAIAISGLSHTNPSICGACDATLTVHGLYAGHTFTLNYDYNGTPQPPITTSTSSTGTITLTGLCSGTYSNFVASYGSCITPVAGPEIISDPTISISNVTRVEPSICGACDGVLVLEGLYPGHYYNITYTLNGVAVGPVPMFANGVGNITLTGLCEGTYDNIVASYSPVCTTPAVGPYSLVGPPPPPAIIVSTTEPTECGKCDGTMRLKAVVPFSSDTISYSFNSVGQTPFVTTSYGDSTIFLPGLCAGIYSGMSIKIGHCVTTVLGSATLTGPPLTSGFDTTLRLGCNGDTVFFHNTSASAGALYYVWDFGDGTSSVTSDPYHVYPAGTYTVKLIATNHYCVDSTLFTFTLGHPLVAAYTQTPEIICQHESAAFTNSSTGATGYAWNFGNGATSNQTDITNVYNNTGTYQVSLIASNGIPCYDTAYSTVIVDTISSFGMIVSDSVICSGAAVTFTGVFADGGYTGISWDFGDGFTIEDKNPIKHSFGTAGVFNISANVHYRACPEISGTRQVTVIQRPVVDLGNDTSICKGSNAIVLTDKINGGNAEARWTWNTGAKTKSIDVVAPGTYVVTVDINNCDASDSVVVTNDCYVDIPNVFTPNGDGLNDYFFPRQLLAKGLLTFSMNIYNRWGQIIFETTSLNGAGWDGRFNGTPQPEGVYVYMIDVTFKDGQKQHHQGNVTLLR